MGVKAIPDGYTSLTPHLIIKGAAKAIEFYKSAFGAVELFSMPGENGCIMHAEMQVGNARFMLADEFPDMGFYGPTKPGATPVGFMIYLEDVDTAFPRAIAAGGIVERPVANQFYGDRSGTLLDPFGHRWTLSTHMEDLTPEEIQRRCQAPHECGN